MLIPRHCAEVAVINAGEGFSPEKTVQDLLGTFTFYMTKYIILREREGQITANERASILKVKTKGSDLVKQIVEGEVLAHPNRCISIVDPDMDEFVLNQVVLRAASLQRDEKDAIILSGRNENITFVYLGDQTVRLPINILLIDTVPPRPNRLVALMRPVTTSRLISDYLVVDHIDIDTSELLQEAVKQGDPVLSPCSVGESPPSNNLITSFNVVNEMNEGDKPATINLIGCSLSKSVLKRLKRIQKQTFEVTLKDICPLHKAREVVSRADVHGFIVRCCKTIESPKLVHVDGKPIMILPWAPSLGMVVNAIDNLVQSILGLEVK